MSFHVPEDRRVREGAMGSDSSYGNCGAFVIAGGLRVIASDRLGWEHVSVSLPHRPPTWEEMCEVKEIFWDPEDCVMQLHPPRSQWINNHPNCLHLWRPVGQEIPRPPSIMVGFK